MRLQRSWACGGALPLVVTLWLMFAGAARAQEARFRGCYDLERGEWRPAVELGPDSLYVGLPPRIKLDTAPGAGRFPGSRDGRALRPSPGAMPSVHEYAWWTVAGRDTLRLVWSNGYSGVAARLAPADSVLRGRARTFWDFERTRQEATVTARRVDCSTPLPEAWRMRRRFPRGIALATGDSLRIGEPVPAGIPVERTRRSTLHLTAVPDAPLAAATRVRVAVDSAGRVRKISVTLPSDTDYEALVARMRSAWGEPTYAATDTLRAGTVSERTAWSSRLISLWIHRSTTPDGKRHVSVFLNDPRR